LDDARCQDGPWSDVFEKTGLLVEATALVSVFDVQR
jgi:hypothetical protein